MFSMSRPVHNFTWHQGEDFVVDITYTISGTPVDLTGYSARMDIAPVAGGTPAAPIFVLNSDDIAGIEWDVPGETDNEITLGADGKLLIKIGRDITLPTGPIGQKLSASVNTFGYDLFLRDAAGMQQKLLQGAIKVEKSITQWQ